MEPNLIKNKWRVRAPLADDRRFSTQANAYVYVKNLTSNGLGCTVYHFDNGVWRLFERLEGRV